MNRVILAPNDVLTPFDLRAQIFRVNVEMFVHYRGQKILSQKCPKVTLSREFYQTEFLNLMNSYIYIEKIVSVKS